MRRPVASGFERTPSRCGYEKMHNADMSPSDPIFQIYKPLLVTLYRVAVRYGTSALGLFFYCVMNIFRIPGPATGVGMPSHIVTEASEARAAPPTS